jgi:hypothetical protein
MGDWAIAEWIRRGYVNNMKPFGSNPVGIWEVVPKEYWPEWYHDINMTETVTESHKLNLLRKDYSYYYKQFCMYPDQVYSKQDIANAQYVWPVTLDDIKVKEVLSICP